MDRSAVEEILRRRIGLDPASGGPGHIERALRSRMRALAIPAAEGDRYVGLLETSATEIDALVEEVVVPESWFFRDEYPFDHLAGPVVSDWLAAERDEPFRILCLPCARGEEPYSIAITLFQRGWPASRFRIDAVDVSVGVLDAARRAVYGPNAFRSARAPAYLDRYFRRENSEYTVDPKVRATVEFRQGNLLDPGLLAGRAAYDAIFCRNLLIYFDTDARRQALGQIAARLSSEGVLFVGHADQSVVSGHGFRQTGDRKCFAFVKGVDTTLSTTTRPPPAPAARKPKVAAIPAEAATVVRAVSSSAPPSHLEAASRLAGEGKHAEAAASCEREIRQRGPSSSVYFLLGVIRQAMGDREGARQSFEKAVYLEPGHEDALLNLALLAERAGANDAAAHYRRRAARSFQEKPST